MATDIDRSYNEAVMTLNTSLLSLRGWHQESSRLKYEGKMGLIIPMINKFINRSGLTDEEVDKLCMIHITGTKGKGSTSAFTESILRQHGYHTGLFTSPHLVEVRERIRVNGKPLSKEKYCHYFWKVYNKLKETEEVGYPIEEGKGMPAYFAFNVILSLHAFLHEGVDVAIMEVGIGGLTDSTNFIRCPVACAITSLGLEHTDDLGDTIESIALQKSGIFKKHCPAITAPQYTSAMQVILNRAKQTQSPLYIVNPLSEEVMKRYNFSLSIAGDKQRHNAALAIQLFQMWEAYQYKNEMVAVQDETTVDEIPRVTCTNLDEATIRGLSTCNWPGRAQTIARKGVTYYLDGAHTKESMELCASWFTEAADQERRLLGRKVARVLIFFTAPERDPEVLVYPLKDCEFDAAVFCPFVVSRVASRNRPVYSKRNVVPIHLEQDRLQKLLDLQKSALSLDLIIRAVFLDQLPDKVEDLQLKKLDPKVESETVIRNKLAWEKLVASTERERNNLRLLKAGWPVNGIAVSQSSDRGSDGESEKSSVVSESDRSDMMSVVSDKMSVENCEESDCTGRLSPGDDLPAVVGDMLNYVIEPSLIVNANLLGEVDNLNKLLQNNPSLEQLSSTDIYTKPSLIFPCIIEALAWAGQGRDDSVQVLDPQAIPQTIPAFLSEADHIQVLATGSLNFVGGVLDVLTSVDDVYSN